MKVFNTTAVCNPEMHYVADTSAKVDKIIAEYIDVGMYFTINRARQYGKTTTLYALANKLSNRYYVIQLSFEWADDLFQSKYDFVAGFVEMVRHELEYAGCPAKLIEKWSLPVQQRMPMSDLNKRITELCRDSEREIILMIDEVDKATNNDIMILFLGLLRDKFIRRTMKKDTTFKSVILAGVYDIKNLKSKIRPDTEHGFNSPWNIAVDFNIDMSLKPQEIYEMLMEYKEDYKLGFDTESFAQQIYDYTSGYPYMVSKICWLLDNEVWKEPEFGTKEKVWTDAGFQRAVKLLVKEDNSLYADLNKKLEDNEELKELIYKIVVGREEIAYNRNDNLVNLGSMFGWIKNVGGNATISNRIFETVICDKLVQEKSGKEGYKPNFTTKHQFISGSELNMSKIMDRFAVHYAELYSEETEEFLEREARMIFLCFLKPIINGTGNYYMESEAFDKTRTDIVVDYQGRRYIIELKIWHGENYEQSGREQLAGYLQKYSLSEGWLLSFCFNRKKEHIVGTKTMELHGKVIHETVV